MQGSMKAVQVHAYGNSDVLLYGDVARPAAQAGEVLIRVHATTVNPFDCAVHTGVISGYFQYELPLIPGTDVSGVVEAVGAGVERLHKGDEVYAGQACRGPVPMPSMSPCQRRMWQTLKIRRNNNEEISGLRTCSRLTVW